MPVDGLLCGNSVPLPACHFSSALARLAAAFRNVM